MRLYSDRRTVYYVFDKFGELVHKTDSLIQASHAATSGLCVVTSKNIRYHHRKYA